MATWNFGNHLSICFSEKGKQGKPVSRLPVAGTSEYRFLGSSPASKVKKQRTHITINIEKKKHNKTTTKIQKENQQFHTRQLETSNRPTETS